MHQGQSPFDGRDLSRNLWTELWETKLEHIQDIGGIEITDILICNINCVWFPMCLDAKNKKTKKHQTHTNCECCCIGDDEK